MSVRHNFVPIIYGMIDICCEVWLEFGTNHFMVYRIKIKIEWAWKIEFIHNIKNIIILKIQNFEVLRLRCIQNVLVFSWNFLEIGGGGSILN